MKKKSIYSERTTWNRDIKRVTTWSFDPTVVAEWSNTAVFSNSRRESVCCLDPGSKSRSGNIWMNWYGQTYSTNSTQPTLPHLSFYPVTVHCGSNKSGWGLLLIISLFFRKFQIDHRDWIHWNRKWDFAQMGSRSSTSKPPRLEEHLTFKY